MTSMQQVIEGIIQEFNAQPGVDEKYAYLFQLGADLPKMDEAFKTEENRVRGCQSNLWFHLTREGDGFYLQADSDSMVVRGIAALLVRITAGQSADEIQKLNLEFINRLDIWKLPSEQNVGLAAMLQKVKDQVSSFEIT